MKRILIILITTFAYNIVHAQTIDTAILTCRYVYSYERDTITPDDRSTRYDYYMFLQIGKHCSKFYSEQTRLADSALEASDTMFPSILPGECWIVYKNYPQGKITFTDLPVFRSNYYIYEEAIEQQKWNIQAEYQTIKKLKCQKAICTYRGRNYEAWFTMEVPVSNGPYKFGGLPGLIVKINDDKNHYVFTLAEIYENKKDAIVFDRHKYVHINRTQHSKIRRERNKDISAYSNKVLNKNSHSSWIEIWNYDIIERDIKP